MLYIYATSSGIYEINKRFPLISIRILEKPCFFCLWRIHCFYLILYCLSSCLSMFSLPYYLSDPVILAISISICFNYVSDIDEVKCYLNVSKLSFYTQIPRRCMWAHRQHAMSSKIFICQLWIGGVWVMWSHQWTR